MSQQAGSAHHLDAIVVPDHLKTLQVGNRAFAFEAVHGIVAGQPVKDGLTLELFFRGLADGADRLVQFDTKLGALPGHEVTFLYASEPGGAPFPVAWCNHSIGQMEYFTEATRARFEGKAGGLMTRAAAAGGASVSDLSGRHGALMNLLILPVTMLLALGALIVGLIGGTTTGQKRATGEALLGRASDILNDSPDMSVPIYTPRRSPLRWILIGGGALLAASVILPLINVIIALALYGTG